MKPVLTKLSWKDLAGTRVTGLPALQVSEEGHVSAGLGILGYFGNLKERKSPTSIGSLTSWEAGRECGFPKVRGLNGPGLPCTHTWELQRILVSGTEHDLEEVLGLPHRSCVEAKVRSLRGGLQGPVGTARCAVDGYTGCKLLNSRSTIHIEFCVTRAP